MDEQTFAHRRDRVREAVIAPLEQMGLRRPGNMKVEDFEAMKARLAERLAWLSSEWHEPLVEIVSRNAGFARGREAGPNPAREIWPSEVAILNWAHTLQPMGRVTRLVGTYMRSRAGREAWERSPAEASVLENFLRQMGRPPELPGGADLIRAKGEELAGRLKAAGLRREQGEPWPEDDKLLAWWPRRKAWLDHLIHGDLDCDPGLAA